MAITTAKSAGPTGDFRGDLEVSNKLPSASDMDNVAHLPVLDAAGASHAFTTLHAHADQRVLIIFIRHFFCGNCQEYIRALSASVTPEALLKLETPTHIVIIGHGHPDLIPFYVKETACPFPVYADPTKQLYDRLGMIRTLSLGPKSPEYMQTSVMMNAVKSMYQEIRSGRNLLKGGDLYQVGGEFVVEDGRVVWCHRMRNTRDHAEVAEIRRVLGLDGGRPITRRRWTTGLGRALSHRRQSWSRSRSGTRKSSPAARVMEKVAEEQGQAGRNGHYAGGHEQAAGPPRE